VLVGAREDLILSAERLYATHGVNGVSLRHISLEAGQKNVSAIQYHFEDRRGLILAIFEFRRGEIEARRRALLDECSTSGRRGDVRALTEVQVRPLAEQAATPGSYYARFLNRMWDHEGRAVVPITDIGADEAHEAGALLIAAVGHDAKLSTVRTELGGRLIIAGIADLERRLNEQAWLDVDSERDAYITAVVDALVGMLTARISIPS